MHAKSELRSYQNRLVTTLYESNGHLVVVPMGGGKTIAGLTTVEELIAAGEDPACAGAGAEARCATGLAR